MTAGGAASELTGRPGSAVAVTATISRANVQQVSGGIAKRVRGLLPGLRPHFLFSPESDVLNLPQRAAGSAKHHGRSSKLQSHSTKLGTQLQTQLISLPGIAARIVPFKGSCPSREAPAAAAGGDQASTAPTGSDDEVIPACIPASAARVLGFSVGDQVTLRDSRTQAKVRVRITGTYSRATPNSPYWMLDPMGSNPVRRTPGFTTAGPLVTSPAVAASARFAFSSVSVLAVPDFRRLSGTGLASLGNNLAARVTSLNNSSNFFDASVTTGLPARLNSLATALVVARTKILAGILTLLVIGGATLALAARLLAQRREAETALIGARGASRRQVARRGLIDAAVVAVPTAIAGPLIGALIAPLLVRQFTAGLTSTVWLAGALVGVGCVAIIGLPWLRRPQSPLRQRAQRGRQRSIAVAVYSNADLAVVALAAGAIWQLIRSAGPVSTGLDGALSADPVLVVAPVLALAGGALLTLRALPLAARLGDRLAARGRGLIVPVAAWQLSRRALREAGPTLVTVLAVAAAVMAVAQRDSWQRSVQAQASFIVGADERVTTAAPLPIGQVARMTSARRVNASTPVVRSGFSLPDGALGTLLALNANAAAGIIPAQAAGPPPAVLRKLAVAPQSGSPIPGHPAALKLTATLTREPLGQPFLFVQLIDAVGVGYQLPAGAVPADGRPHELTITLAPQHHADYPLRVAGFTLQYNLPGHQRPAVTLTVSHGLALTDTSGSSGRSSAFKLAAAGGPLIFTAEEQTGGTNPTALGARAAPDGVLTATFKPGAAAGFLTTGVASSTAQVTVTESFHGGGKPLPAVVSRSMLTGSGLHVGSRLELSVGGTDVPIIPVATVKYLPTVGAAPAVLVDQRALDDALQVRGAPPPAITEWWLHTSGQPVLTGLPPDSTKLYRARVAQSLLADPLTLASQQALLAIAIAAVLLALVGMLVSVATAAERTRDLALLNALGMPPRQVARMLALEQAMTAVATSVVGAVFGIALSKVIVPADTLTAKAARPIPPLVVQVPWLTVAVIALVMAAVPTLAIMFTAPRPDSAAPMIRLEGEA
ncbi:MAG: ABC transporter permease [Nocardiopsaceae bacterium]|nr:ABC transporter permease [Nocardiopsaceae bacterium]